LDSYVSNIDDHLVASSILAAKDPLDINSIKTAINDSSLTTYNSASKRFLRYLEDHQCLEDFLLCLTPVRRLFCVPNESSYAPFQFFFTQMLISKNQSLKQLLFWGRLPSLFFSLLSILLFIYLIYQISPGVLGQISSLIVISIYAFSLESIIYAKQMESYAIGLFASVLLLLLLYKIFKKTPKYNLKHWFSISFFLALMIYMQYQMLIYVLAAMFTLFCYYYNNSKQEQKRILFKRSILSVVIVGLIVAPVYILFISKHSNHASTQWYQGANSEYLFSITGFNGVIAQLGYTAHFFLFNTAEVFFNNCTFYSGNNAYANFLLHTTLLLFLFFFIFGLLKMYKNTEIAQKYLGMFFFVVIIIWLSFVLLGKLTLSPTRHSLILLPVFCAAAHFGICAFMRILSNHRLFVLFIYLTTCIIIFTFAKSIRLFMDDRCEIYTSQAFVKMIKSRNPDYIVTKNEIVTLVPEFRDNVNLLLVSQFKSRERWVSNKFITKTARFCFIDIDPTPSNLKSISRFFEFDLSKLKFDTVHVDNDILFLRKIKTDELHYKFPRNVENSIYFAEYSF
jgi:hypothetical protein